MAGGQSGGAQFGFEYEHSAGPESFDSGGRPRMAIDTRHRDNNGEISRKHGNTLIRTLRKTLKITPNHNYLRLISIKDNQARLVTED